MLALIQRVSWAEVTVNQNTIASIKKGILAFIGIEKNDTEKQADRLLERIITYRIFDDAEGKMNLNLQDVHGGLLLVSQFTLVADTKKGTRPGFSDAMLPAASKILFEYLVNAAKRKHAHLESGEFGANMKVSLCNEGPATFWLKS